MSDIGLALLVALVASLAATPLVASIATRLGIVDKPAPRKVHKEPTPLLGGIAMQIGILLSGALFLRGAGAPQLALVLLASTGLLVVGIFDDLDRLHSQVKLMLAMPAAALLVTGFGVRFPLPESLQALSFGVTILWIVGITAAFAILDHMDGLCAGVAAFASGCIALLAALGGQPLLAALAAAVCGAAAGFLRWNFRPARIFMGDGGAMSLGFLCSVLAIGIRVPDGAAWAPALVAILVLAVPIFDTALVIVSRSRRGLIPFAAPGKDHAAHRLQNLGLSVRGAVLTMYAAVLLFGSLAFLAVRLAPAQALLLAIGLALVAALCIAAFERAPFERQELHAAELENAPGELHLAGRRGSSSHAAM